MKIEQSGPYYRPDLLTEIHLTKSDVKRLLSGRKVIRIYPNGDEFIVVPPKRKNEGR